MRVRICGGAALMLLLFGLISCDTANNFDAPDYFVKYYGSDGDQQGVDMAMAPDGSVYLLGNSTTSNGETQMYVVKTNADGIMIWFYGSKENGLGGTEDEEARDIEITSTGDLVVVGNTVAVSGRRDLMIILLNATAPPGANRETGRYVHVLGSSDEDVNTVTETSDSFIVAGSTDGVITPGTDLRDAFFYRFYKNLTAYPATWTTRLSNSPFDVGVKIFEVNPSLFYCFGYTQKDDYDNIADLNVWIFPLGVDGVPLHNFFVPNSVIEKNDGSQTDPSNDERVTSVVPIPVASRGGFAITGYTTTYLPGTSVQNLFVIHVRGSLETIRIDSLVHYRKRLFLEDPRIIADGSSPQSNAMARVIPSFAPEGYLVLGNENLTGNDNLFLTKLRRDSVTLADAWSSPAFFLFGGAGNDTPGAVAETPDGRILILGTAVLGNATQTKMALMKVNTFGKFQE